MLAEGLGLLLIDEEKEVETLAQIPAGENVRKPGSDVSKGDLVIKKGEKLSGGGGEVGTLAFVGRTEVCMVDISCFGSDVLIDFLDIGHRYSRYRFTRSLSLRS